jgi:hypothetical protein
MNFVPRHLYLTTFQAVTKKAGVRDIGMLRHDLEGIEDGRKGGNVSRSKIKKRTLIRTDCQLQEIILTTEGAAIVNLYGDGIRTGRSGV